MFSFSTSSSFPTFSAMVAALTGMSANSTIPASAIVAAMQTLAPMFALMLTNDQIYDVNPNTPLIKWYLAKATSNHGGFGITKGQTYMISKVTFAGKANYVAFNMGMLASNDDIFVSGMSEHAAKSTFKTLRSADGKLTRVQPEFELVLNYLYGYLDQNVSDAKLSSRPLDLSQFEHRYSSI